MKRDLFYIPPEWNDIPLFGFGLLLFAWLALSGIILLRQVRKFGWKNAETQSHLITTLVVSALISFVAPRLMVMEHGEVLGIPIRGYGVMLLLAVVSGVALALYRAQKQNVPPEAIQSLTLWLFVFGIVGARLFFVIQKWDEFRQSTLVGTIVSIASITQGGLVVYGSFLGACVGFLLFVRRHRLPTLPLADVIAPSLLLGLAIGRIGCLLNGCCYGGICHYPWGLSFPPTSPPYLEQIVDGTLFGFELEQTDIGVRLIRVDPHSAAGGAHLPEGTTISHLNGVVVRTVKDAQQQLFRSNLQLFVETSDGRQFVLDTPKASRAVHPTQIYSATNALVLLLAILAWEPLFRWSGMVIASTLTLYPLTRALLEMIRVDEKGIAGTGMTISQHVSLLLAIAVVALWCYVFVRRQPRSYRVTQE